MPCDGFDEESYGLFTLGSLSGTEEEEIRRHLLNGCSTCEAEVRELRNLWYSVSLTAPDRKPSGKLRRRVLDSVRGRSAWWDQPFRVVATAAALIVAVAGGWVLGEHRYLPAQAFSPVYRLPLPESPTNVQTAAVQPDERPVPVTPRPIVRQAESGRQVARQTDDPSQAAAIQSLNQDLFAERRRGAQLEADLASQRALVAVAQQAVQDSNRRLLAASGARPPSDDLPRQVAVLTERTQELERQVNTYRALLEVQRKRLDQNLQLASLVSDPRLRVVQLRATEKENTVEGHALIAGGSQMAFYANALPALPANRVYQLWLLRSNGRGVVSGGVFAPDTAKRGFVQVNDPTLLSSVTAIVVTDEPAGGSTLPTGHKWLIGS